MTVSGTRRDVGSRQLDERACRAEGEAEVVGQFCPRRRRRIEEGIRDRLGAEVEDRPDELGLADSADAEIGGGSRVHLGSERWTWGAGISSVA